MNRRLCESAPQYLLEMKRQERLTSLPPAFKETVHALIDYDKSVRNALWVPEQTDPRLVQVAQSVRRTLRDSMVLTLRNNGTLKHYTRDFTPRTDDEFPGIRFALNKLVDNSLGHPLLSEDGTNGYFPAIVPQVFVHVERHGEEQELLRMRVIGFGRLPKKGLLVT